MTKLPYTPVVKAVPYNGPHITRLTVEFTTLPSAIQAQLAQRIYALITEAVYDYEQRDSGLTDLAQLSQRMGDYD